MSTAEPPQAEDWATPFERGVARGDANQSSTWAECIGFHQRLAQAFPQWVRCQPVGVSDAGRPIHQVVFQAEGCLDADLARQQQRPVVLFNHGIHPGEPEGIDAGMALLRDLCLDASARQRLGALVLVTIPVYNVDGACNRGQGGRVDQNGPEAFGFRGNARHLDLNRDFIKADSLNTRVFTQVFTTWDPDVLVDTHTSNGADYQHVMTLIATQADKLGGQAGRHLRERMLPALYDRMAALGDPMCPYVNTVADTPDQGITGFLDTPRFSTGYAALHHTLGFMPETHMLKPFADRLHSVRRLLEAVLAHVAAHGAALRAARAADRVALQAGAPVALDWALDRQTSRPVPFRGFHALREPSRLGRYQRLRYDRSAPWQRDIPLFDRFHPTVQVVPPTAYLLPQAWHDVAERLRAHGVVLQAAAQAAQGPAQRYRITHFEKSPRPFEGRHLHTRVDLRCEDCTAQVNPGDWLIRLGGRHDRLVIEMLEPHGVDSWFRWGFFDSVLDRKEGFSDYAFEDQAERLLDEEPGLRALFQAWQAEHPDRQDDAQAVLGFIHTHAQRHAEPAWCVHPVLRLAFWPGDGSARFGDVDVSGESAPSR